jgi:predicted membrane-bound spermidine synthase
LQSKWALLPIICLFKELMKQSAERKQLSDRKWLLAAFIEGAVVLSVEILGAKILTPFFGNSLIVWTSIIGTTITFLTIGYYTGGVLSRKQDLQKILSYLLSVAAVFILLMPTWSLWLFKIFADGSLYSSIMAAFFLLGPPMLTLGATSPIIIQHLTRKVSSSGEKSGMVYAVSTLGGICFVFILGFWIIPAQGISVPLVLLSLLLLLFAVSIFRGKLHIVFAILFVLFLLKFFQGHKRKEGKGMRIPYMTEGLMGQLEVLDKVYPGNATSFRHLIINGIPETIITNNEEAISGWSYTHKTAMVASLKKNNADVLLFGFGGGVMATEFSRMKMKTDVVEIDGRLLNIAKRYFYFNDSSITYTVDDARHYMRTAVKKYDLIVFDVFNGEVTPSYLFTTEGVKELQKLLKKDGIITIQFNELINASDKSAYQSICNTLLAGGYKVYFNMEPDEITSILIVASASEIDFTLLDKKNFNPCCNAQGFTEGFIKKPMEKFLKLSSKGLILTDDRPMLDVLNAKTLRFWREWSIKNYALPQLYEDQKIFR